MTGNLGFFNWLQQHFAAEVDRINRERAGGPKGWRLRRVITRGFWLTDREEFHIPHGRLVFNGHNGSGKSVLLAAAIPFSLDNDKSAYRLNTFKGDRSRSIRYFAVGSKDDIYHPGFYYEARTVYYLLEWEWFGDGAPPGLRDRWAQGQQTRFLTTGVGLTASTVGGDVVDSWGFVITDGRRVGFGGFDVVDERGECLSFPALRALLKDGGEARKESSRYRELVNQYLFGFQQTAEFDALLDTLLQVRSSKLGGELKPSHVTAILRQSLPELPAEKMERLARIIGDLDDTQASLESLQDALAVAQQVHTAAQAVHTARANLHAFDYLQAHRDAVQKQRQHHRVASDVVRNEQELATAEQGQKEAEQQLQTAVLQITNLQEVHSEILDSESVLAGRRDALEQQRRRVAGQERSVTTAQTNLDTTRRELRQMDEQFRKEKRELGAQASDLIVHADTAHWPDVRNAALVLGGAASAFALDGEEPPAAPDLSRLREEGDRRAVQLDEARKTARLAAELKGKYQAAQEQVGQQSRALTEAANRLQQAQQGLEGAREAAADGLRTWRESCQEFTVPAEDWDGLLAQIAQQAEEFDKDELLAPLQQAIIQQRRERDGEINRVDVRIRLLAETYREKKAERDRKAAEPEAQPARPEAAVRARQILKEQGIAAVPLYEACDFRPEVEPAVQGAVEGFLERAGLLDALIVSRAQRSAALELLRAQGLGDALLAPDGTQPLAGERSERTLASVLRPDADAAGTAVAEVLAAIAWSGEVWTHGLLLGTTGTDAAASYVGVGNRRRKRKEELAALDAALVEITLQGTALRQQKEALQRRVAAMEGEGERLRLLGGWGTLKEGIRLYVAVQREYGEARERLKTAQEEASRTQQAWKTQEKLFLAQVAPLGCDPAVDEEGLLTMGTAVRAAVALIHHGIRGLWESLSRLQRQWGEKQASADSLYGALQAETRKFGSEQSNLGSMQAAYDDLVNRFSDAGSVAIRTQYQQLLAERARLEQEVRTCGEKAVAARAKLETLGPQLQQVEQEKGQAVLTERYRLGDLQESVRAYPILVGSASLEGEDPALWLAFAEERMASGASGTGRDTSLARKRWEDGVELARRVLGNLLSGDNAFILSKRCHFTQPTDGLHYVRFFIEHSQYHPFELVERFEREVAEHEERLNRAQIELMEGFVLRELADDIGALIRRAEVWARGINDVLADNTFAGMKFRIKWTPITSSVPGSEIAASHTLLLKDADLLTDEEREQLLAAFKGEIYRVRYAEREGNLKDGFVATMKQVLDYRNWFQFIIYRRVWDEQRQKWSEQALTDATHAPGSGGEKALSLIVPLVAAVHARYQAAAEGAPRLIALDEAFAGIDAGNTREAYDFLVRLGFNWIMTSEKLLAVSEALPAAATYTLEAPKGTKDFFATPTLWDGHRTIEAVLPGSAYAEVAAAQEEDR